MNIAIHDQSVNRYPDPSKKLFTPAGGIKATVQDKKDEDRKNTIGMNNKKYEAMNNHLVHNNKKLNNIIENYNKFLDKYENENYKKTKVLENLQKEVGKMENSLYKPPKSNRVAPLLLEPCPSFDFDKPKTKTKRNIENKNKEPHKPKNAHPVNNPLAPNNEQLYQYLLMANLLEDDNTNKGKKKQTEEVKKIEKTVNQQNEFLMFLMEKNLPENARKNGFESGNILDRLEAISDKLNGGRQKKPKKIKAASNNKMKEIHNFLNQNLIKNYQLLENLTNKKGSKAHSPIFMPNKLFNTKI